MCKFPIDLNTAVFTTRFILEGAPILFVYHDEDGSWQFIGNDDIVNDNDMKLVALREIIEMDESLLKLAEMPMGSEAMRSDKAKHWKILNSN